MAYILNIMICHNDFTCSRLSLKLGPLANADPHIAHWSKSAKPQKRKHTEHWKLPDSMVLGDHSMWLLFIKDSWTHICSYVHRGEAQLLIRSGSDSYSLLFHTGRACNPADWIVWIWQLIIRALLLLEDALTTGLACFAVDSWLGRINICGQTDTSSPLYSTDRPGFTQPHGGVTTFERRTGALWRRL